MLNILLAVIGILILTDILLHTVFRRKEKRDTRQQGMSLRMENFYMHLFRHMNVPLLLLDDEGIIRTVNRRAALSLQDRSAAMPGKNFLDFVYREDREALRTAIDRVQENKAGSEPLQQNRWIIRNDGSAFLARLTLSMLKDMEQENTILCEMIDISRNMMQDKQIREYTQTLESRLSSRNQELSEKNRLLALKNRELIKINKTKNTFFTNISHELRTPLVAVSGYIEMLLEHRFGAVNEDIRKAFTIANENIQRLIGFINNLLTLARVDSYRDVPDYQQVDIREQAERVLFQFREKAGENGVLLFNDIPDALPKVLADPKHIDQILFNLISNAVKFTDSGEIRITAVELMQGRVEMQVRDTGCGIPPEETENVFNRFYQVERKSTTREMGSGLGLAIVREIVNHYSGKIAIKENPGGGTIVSVELYGPRKSPEPVRKSGKILTISSNEQQNLLIRTFFQEAGYRVESARTGLQAIELAEQNSFDLIFTDLLLPDLEGTEICTLLRDRGNGEIAPVYIVTFSVSEEERNRIFISGARGLLTKPFRKEALRRILEENSFREESPNQD